MGYQNEYEREAEKGHKKGRKASVSVLILSLENNSLWEKHRIKSLWSYIFSVSFNACSKNAVLKTLTENFYSSGSFPIQTSKQTKKKSNFKM